jgi:hypothetical protein
VSSKTADGDTRFIHAAEGNQEHSEESSRELREMEQSWLCHGNDQLRLARADGGVSHLLRFGVRAC